MSKTFKRYAIILAILMLTVFAVACTKKDNGDDNVTRVIEIIVPAKELPNGAAMQLNPKLTPEVNGLVWRFESTNTEIATVSETGFVEGLQVGVTEIKATTSVDEKDIEGTIQITVSPTTENTPVVEVSFNDDKDVIQVNDTAQLKYNLKDSNSGIPAAYSLISSNADIASISTSGLITGKAQGEVTFSAMTTIDGIQYKGTSVKMTVKPLPTDVQVELQQGTILQRGTTTATAKVFPEDSLQNVIWTSSDNSVATINDNGLITGIAGGTATITATTKNGTAGDAKSGSATITVKSLVEITPKDTVLVVEANDTVKLQAQLRTSVEEFAPNAEFVWSIDSGEEYATIDVLGEVKAIESGNVVIRATLIDDEDIDTFNTITITVVKTPVANEFVNKFKHLEKIGQNYVTEFIDKPDLETGVSQTLKDIVNSYMTAKIISIQETNSQHNTNYTSLVAHIQLLCKEFTPNFIEFIDQIAVDFDAVATEFTTLTDDVRKIVDEIGVNNQNLPTVETVNALQYRLDALELNLNKLIDTMQDFVQKNTSSLATFELSYLQSILTTLNSNVTTGVRSIKKDIEFIREEMNLQTQQ